MIRFIRTILESLNDSGKVFSFFHFIMMKKSNNTDKRKLYWIECSNKEHERDYNWCKENDDD